MNLPAGVTATTHKTRDEWLDDRQGSTGASSIASLFGVGWGTQLQEYAKATGAMPPTVETEAMRMGHIMQPVIRSLFDAETLAVTRDWGEFTLLRNTEFPHMHCTLDYAIMRWSHKRTYGVLECKNVGPHMTREWVEDGELPLDVQMQVQHQLAVTGWEWGAVAAILAGGQFVYQFVERNEDFIQSLASRVDRFWQHVEAGEPPEPTADDGEALRLLHPRHVPGKTIELPGRFLEFDARLRENKRISKKLRLEIMADENFIKAQFGDAEKAVLPDGGTYTYKRQVRKAHTVAESESRVLRRLKG